MPTGLSNKLIKYITKDLPQDEKSTSIKIMRKRAQQLHEEGRVDKKFEFSVSA